MKEIFQVIAVSLCLLAGVSSAEAQFDGDQWFFSAEEIKIAYRYQEQFGERIQHPLRARDCLLGKKEFTASYAGNDFVASCRFISETIRQLKQMFEQGAVRYLFSLDADHAHLAVPLELWENTYRKLPREKLLPALLAEPALAALYHTAEHLVIVTPGTGGVDSKTRAWKEKRNVVGYYDGRPIEILHPDPRGLGLNIPPPYYSLAGFNFLASPRGELALFLKSGPVMFDITFDVGDERDDSATAKITMSNTSR